MTADPASDTLTAAKSLARMDGVRFSAVAGGELPSPLHAGVDYFLLNARDGTSRSARRRRRSRSTEHLGQRRVGGARTGDRRHEGRALDVCATPPPSRVPSIFASKEAGSMIGTCVWDTENGWMK